MNGATGALRQVSRTGMELRDEEEDENDEEVKRDEHCTACCMGRFVVEVVGIEEEVFDSGVLYVLTLHNIYNPGKVKSKSLWKSLSAILQ